MKTALWIIALCKLFEIFVAMAGATAKLILEHKEERERKERIQRMVKLTKSGFTMEDINRNGSI